jgi:hypothetical protein
MSNKLFSHVLENNEKFYLFVEDQYAMAYQWYFEGALNEGATQFYLKKVEQRKENKNYPTVNAAIQRDKKNMLNLKIK